MPCLYIYGDESGVFDQAHHELFVYGGLILPSKKAKARALKAYAAVENQVRAQTHGTGEIKAVGLSESRIESFLHALEPFGKYACVIKQKRVSADIFRDKKTKQRYLDYVFEEGLRQALSEMEQGGLFKSDDITAVRVAFDNHTVPTNNAYELTEGLETELALGSCDFARNECVEGLFPRAKGNVTFRFSDSKSETLIRAADMICHHVYARATAGERLQNTHTLKIVSFPK